MGNSSSQQTRLKATTERAAKARGNIAIHSRYNKLPKKLEDDYIVEKTVLGTGYNGSVFMAKRKDTGKKYAVKGFHLNGVTGEKMEQLEVECEIFLSMDHPHVARLVDVYENETHLNLVMECMEGGELFERLSKRKRFTEKDASHAMWQMLLSVNYLHARGVVHRDLKLENFLYEHNDTDHLKLIDFGFSHIWEPNTKMALSCGTLAYVAPEVLKRNYTSKCDLWSLGVILFILLAGYMPFSGAERTQRKAIEEGKYSWRPERWDKISKEAIDLVKQLLLVDADKRPSCEIALKHPFILKHDVPDTDRGGAIDVAAATALMDFAKASKFRRACMSVMAWSLTNEERAKVRQIFISMDKNQQGTITMLELKEVLSTHLGLNDEQAKTVFEALDSSNDDQIHYTEFLAAMISTRIAMHDDLLAQTFQRFDVDNSGFITLDNLKQVLGETFDGKEIEGLLKEADKTGDGKISYAEFIEFMKSGEMSDEQLEAAHKLIDHELEKEQAPVMGSIAWLKSDAKSKDKPAESFQGGLSVATTSATSESAKGMSSSGTDSAKLPDPTSSTVAVHGSEKLSPGEGDKKKEKKSRACAIQ